jgi:hypothetical protein
MVSITMPYVRVLRGAMHVPRFRKEDDDNRAQSESNWGCLEMC